MLRGATNARSKERALRFLKLLHIGRARIVVPLPAIAEWWRGRTDTHEEILAATQIVATVEIMKAAGIALARTKNVDAKLTVDAIVMATAAMLDAVFVTADAADFNKLASHFSRVPILTA